MKKKLSGFLCAGAILFFILFWGCSDLSVDKEEALSADLPGDFNWEEYATINRDVSSSQIAFDVQKKLVNAQEAYGYSELNDNAANTLANSAKRIKECMEILKDSALAAAIYLQYANCPKKGWDPDEACTGLYANNTNYTIPKSNGNGVTCSIGACWRDGWDESFSSDPGYNGPGFADELKVIIGGYTGGDLNSIKNANHRNVISMLCNFILPQSKNFKATEDYLKGFYFFDNSNSFVSGSSLNTTLIKQHYFLVGRSEGRPYKYCSGTESQERNINLALVFKKSDGFTKYDYSSHFFCLNKVDYKIYVTQEGR